ncbi:MAG: hypothetical protein VYC17_00170 [Nitrospinota bacterium]|nr:hypothetical protein [Nitrospinota bacterium]
MSAAKKANKKSPPIVRYLNRCGCHLMASIKKADNAGIARKSILAVIVSPRINLATEELSDSLPKTMKNPYAAKTEMEKRNKNKNRAGTRKKSNPGTKSKKTL